MFAQARRATQPSDLVRSPRLTHSYRDIADKEAALSQPIIQRKATCACGGGCPACQAKSNDLKISQPNDPAEIEADQVADRVMRMPDDSVAAPEGPVGVSTAMPILQRTEADGEQPKEEGSRCPSWRGDPESISKRAGEFYARNHLTPPSQAAVERIQCEPPIANGNYGCYVHFSDGLVLRVIVRETDIVVGTGPGPITTEHPPPATPLCFYEYSCPEGELVLTVKKCQSSKPSGSSGPPLVAQRAALSGAMAPRTAPSSLHDVLNSSGQQLDSATRAFFEPRFGYDLSHVRVHSDPLADQSARDVNAQAYTVGSQIVFGTGRFSPGTMEGRRLLAHELTHVIQQGRSARSIQRQTEGLPASSLIPSLSAAPLGNQDCLPDQSCSVSAATPVSGAPLSAAQVTSRRQQVQQAIDRARATYPVAAGNLQHWLDNTGSTRILPGSIFQAADSGVPAFLERGQLSQEAHLDMFRDGIQRRLGAGDPESLLPTGTRRVLRYCNSMRASPVGVGVEGDLSIALGGFTVKSWVTLSALLVSSSIPLVTQYQVRVESWRVQVCDRYDWIAGALAQMPIPLADSSLEDIPFPPDAVQITPAPVPGYSTVRLRDNWFRELEAAGGGRQYGVYSEIFDAPASLRAILEGYTFNVL